MSELIQRMAKLVQTIKNSNSKAGEPPEEFMEFKISNIFANVDFQKEAQDQHGNLHPQYILPVQKGFQAVEDYVELYSNDILNTVRQIDLLCIKTANRTPENYENCKRQTNEDIHRKIFTPLVNSSVLIYKAANQCLLKGNSIDICANLVSDHTYFTFKLAAQRIKIMTYPLKLKVPDQFKMQYNNQNSKLNNALD